MTTPTAPAWSPEFVRRKTAGALRRVARRVAPPDPPPPRPDLVATTQPVADAQLRYRAVAERADADRFVPEWPAPIGPGRLGQLEAEFQAHQQQIRARVEPEDCEWYHEIDLGDGERIAGAWDLIGNETVYLGGIPLAGARVLEMGPASGHLTIHMEHAGADVVAFDAGLDACIDMVGVGDLEGDRFKVMRFIGQVQNSWWWVHRHHQAQARAVYGSIYDLPADIGRFDVSLFAAILLHLRDPYLALQQAALRTDGAIVVTDVVPGGLVDWDAQTMLFHPVEGNRNSWWQLSPALIQRMLNTLEFRDQQVTRHVQYTRPWHDIGRAKEPVEFYTIVARR